MKFQHQNKFGMNFVPKVFKWQVSLKNVENASLTNIIFIELKHTPKTMDFALFAEQKLFDDFSTILFRLISSHLSNSAKSFYRTLVLRKTLFCNNFGIKSKSFVIRMFFTFNIGVLRKNDILIIQSTIEILVISKLHPLKTVKNVETGFFSLPKLKAFSLPLD
jgi:hypothetical protein